MITQQKTQFRHCSKDYVTTLYPAWGQFLLPKDIPSLRYSFDLL